MSPHRAIRFEEQAKAEREWEQGEKFRRVFTTPETSMARDMDLAELDRNRRIHQKDWEPRRQALLNISTGPRWWGDNKTPVSESQRVFDLSDLRRAAEAKGDFKLAAEYQDEHNRMREAFSESIRSAAAELKQHDAEEAASHQEAAEVIYKKHAAIDAEQERLGAMAKGLSDLTPKPITIISDPRRARRLQEEAKKLANERREREKREKPQGDYYRMLHPTPETRIARDKELAELQRDRRVSQEAWEQRRPVLLRNAAINRGWGDNTRWGDTSAATELKHHDAEEAALYKEAEEAIYKKYAAIDAENERLDAIEESRVAAEVTRKKNESEAYMRRLMAGIRDDTGSPDSDSDLLGGVKRRSQFKSTRGTTPKRRKRKVGRSRSSRRRSRSSRRSRSKSTRRVR